MSKYDDDDRKDMILSLIVVTTIIGVIVLSATIMGCTNTVVESSANALKRSQSILQPLTELGLTVRTANDSMTVKELRSTHNVTKLSDLEAQFIHATIDEHNQTIEALLTLDNK